MDRKLMNVLVGKHDVTDDNQLQICNLWRTNFVKVLYKERGI